ncbi:replication-associated recombination protein A [Guggenheimella bovis]
MDFFDLLREEQLEEKRPLAQRMKPKNLDEVVGQADILGPGKLLRRLIEADRLTSIILYGPSGTGKTSLAVVISKATKSEFLSLNAVTSGIKDIKEVVEKAKRSLELSGRRTILFIDEIHRFNKSQQDALLPHVEEGIVTLIGATTENPYFEVNTALLSRSMVFELKRLNEDDLVSLLERALKDDAVLKNESIEISPKCLALIAKESAGDGRRALNILELAVLTTEATDGKKVLTEEVLSECTQTPFLKYDRDGDYHYDVISSFIKSVRGSDPDAALYYLAQMLKSGEDPKFIARRLVILAAEDIGLADPQALVVANAGFEVVNKIGMPEARIVLSEVALYLALAEKSNSAYVAIDEALSLLSESGQADVPLHLKDQTNKKLKGINVPYKYPHDTEKGYVKQSYLPEIYKDKVFYRPKTNGKEKELIRLWDERRK